MLILLLFVCFVCCLSVFVSSKLWDLHKGGAAIAVIATNPTRSISTHQLMNNASHDQLMNTASLQTLSEHVGPVWQQTFPRISQKIIIETVRAIACSLRR